MARETAREAFRLVEEIEKDYAEQLKKMQDPQVGALLETLRMFHENDRKKLEGLLSAMTGEKRSS